MTDGPPKSYDQLCPVAFALDHLGGRWTLLIVRELLGADARFADLRKGLPGIATNLLTERLRRLEASGVVERRRVHGVTLYALTPLGQQLRTAIEALGAWGLATGPAPGTAPSNPTSARGASVALQSMLDRVAGPLRRVVLTIVFTDVDDIAVVEFGGGVPPCVRRVDQAGPGPRVTTTMTALFELDRSAFVTDPGSEEALAALVDAIT